MKPKYCTVITIYLRLLKSRDKILALSDMMHTFFAAVSIQSCSFMHFWCPVICGDFLKVICQWYIWFWFISGKAKSQTSATAATNSSSIKDGDGDAKPLPKSSPTKVDYSFTCFNDKVAGNHS